ncbi:MAG: hypothetical protein PUF83_03290 [Intestinibaculum porci]|uniref:hypothetical protein n=1 Tax=Intestinibaculum porci TaxID=2487118 RepID=UPI00240967A8|nr:hypothetical protein [Intestinibaculum porci]MDD6422068.1 hypothetical protein [Intestinibaculum porci]
MIKSHCQNDQKQLKEYDLVNPYREKRETVLPAIMNSTKVKGPPKDLKAGLAYLKKARDCGDYAGVWLIDILASSPRDLDQAFAKYAKHCDKNEYVQIGECYLEGGGG